MNRWFDGPFGSAGSNGGGHENSPVRNDNFSVLPLSATDSWRSWLVTGVRRGAFDRRRIKGANKGLKKMLIEGTADSDDPQPWNGFSSAMIRQSVDEALNALPSDQKQAVKLAYFGGLTNREIAEQLGVGERGVRRRLREALAAVSTYVERGRVAGRRAVYAILGLLTTRSILEAVHRASGPAADHMVQAAAVTVGVVAAAVIVANSAPTAPDSQLRTGGGVHSATPAGNPQLPAGVRPLPVVSLAVPNAPRVAPLPENGTVPGERDDVRDAVTHSPNSPDRASKSAAQHSKSTDSNSNSAGQASDAADHH